MLGIIMEQNEKLSNSPADSLRASAFTFQVPGNYRNVEEFLTAKAKKANKNT
jgi:hypothetical protein